MYSVINLYLICSLTSWSLIRRSSSSPHQTKWSHWGQFWFCGQRSQLSRVYLCLWTNSILSSMTAASTRPTTESLWRWVRTIRWGCRSRIWYQSSRRSRQNCLNSTLSKLSCSYWRGKTSLWLGFPLLANNHQFLSLVCLWLKSRSTQNYKDRWYGDFR